MKIITISDTHNKHKKLNKDQLNNCDILIHAGDFTSIGYHHEVESFLKWLTKLKCRNIIFSAGNHNISIICDLNYNITNNPIEFNYEQI